MEEMKQRIHPKLLQLLKQLKYNSLGFFFLSFITPIIAYHEFNANGFEMPLLFSINIVGSMLSSPFASVLSDDKDVRAHLILGSSIGRLAAYMVIYGGVLLGSYWLMVGGTFLLGIGFGTSFFWVPLQTILSLLACKY